MQEQSWRTWDAQVSMKFRPTDFALPLTANQSIRVGALLMLTTLAVWVIPLLTTQRYVQYPIILALLLFLVLLTTMWTRPGAKPQGMRSAENSAAGIPLDLLAHEQGLDDILWSASQYVGGVLDGQLVVMLPSPRMQLVPTSVTSDSIVPDEHEQGVVQWVYDHHERAGLGTQTLPGSRGVYLPLLSAGKVLGVLCVYPKQLAGTLPGHSVSFLEALATQIASAIEHLQTTTHMRGSGTADALLSSVSHELRTPLTSVTGAIETLFNSQGALSIDTQNELMKLALEESERLNGLIESILEMASLDAGAMEIHQDWEALGEIIGTTLARLGKQFPSRHINVSGVADLPLMWIDGVLVGRVLTNLLDNAIRYSSPGSPIDVSAIQEGSKLHIQVADRGPGFPIGEENKVFDKFYRIQPTSSGGMGLGLTICRKIISALHGSIRAENRDGGGAIIHIILPLAVITPLMFRNDEDELHEGSAEANWVE